MAAFDAHIFETGTDERRAQRYTEGAKKTALGPLNRPGIQTASADVAEVIVDD